MYVWHNICISLVHWTLSFRLFLGQCMDPFPLYYCTVYVLQFVLWTFSSLVILNILLVWTELSVGHLPRCESWAPKYWVHLIPWTLYVYLFDFKDNKLYRTFGSKVNFWTYFSYTLTGDHSFLKKRKERKERNVLLQRT